MATNNNGGQNGNPNQGASRLGSFAGSHPDFKGDVPDSFKKYPALTNAFDHARDPLIRTQIEDMQRTESERREGGNGDTPKMIKRHKPYPELKPNYPSPHPTNRNGFNHYWIEEQRNARMQGFKIARAKQKPQQPNPELTSQLNNTISRR